MEETRKKNNFEESKRDIILGCDSGNETIRRDARAHARTEGKMRDIPRDLTDKGGGGVCRRSV